MWVVMFVWTVLWVWMSRWFWDSAYYVKYKTWMKIAKTEQRNAKQWRELVSKYKQSAWMWKRCYEQNRKKDDHSVPNTMV